MDYRKIYTSLIEKRRTSKPIGYVEKHHIIPKSEGGTDNDVNIVALTAREHYIAHLLLAKIYDDYKMYAAVIFMQAAKERWKSRTFKFNSRLYEYIRKEFAIKNSEWHKGKPTWNKGIPQSEEAKRKNSEAHKGRTTWMKGKHHSEVAKSKLSAARKGRKFGHLSEEHRKAISAGNKGRKCANKGKRWINDGVKNSYILIDEELPSGFKFGRIKFTHKKKSSGN